MKTPRFSTKLQRRYGGGMRTTIILRFKNTVNDFRDVQTSAAACITPPLVSRVLHLFALLAITGSSQTTPLAIDYQTYHY
jgi:hypothetical protein